MSDQDGLHLHGAEVTQDVRRKQRRHLENNEEEDVRDADAGPLSQNVLGSRTFFLPTILCSVLRSERVYLSEQHKLGELPGQHEAQGGDAQGDHGGPARVPRSGETGERESALRPGA